MSNNWEITTDTRKDAIHFSKIGAYAGFVWCAFIILAGVITVFRSPDDILNMDDNGVYLYFGELVFMFILVWVLSWRIFSGKGYISSIVLLICFIGSRLLLIIDDPTNIFRGIIISGFMLYAMYAGILGTQAMRKFNNNSKIDADVFN